MHGKYHANHAMDNADFILNIGSRFDDRIVGRYDSFGKNAKIVHIDIDEAELNKVVKTDIPVHADAKQFLREILAYPGLQKLSLNSWHKKIQKWETQRPYVASPE